MWLEHLSVLTRMLQLALELELACSPLRLQKGFVAVKLQFTKNSALRAHQPPQGAREWGSDGRMTR